MRAFDPDTASIKLVKPSKLLDPGCSLFIPKNIHQAETSENRHGPTPLWLVQQLRQSVLFQNKDFIAINKPSQLSVQGGRNVKYSIDSATSHAFGSAEIRLVHRLDKEVTGVLLLARDADAAAWLSAEMKNGHIRKQYWAILSQRVRPLSGTVKTQIQDAKKEWRSAVTKYSVLHESDSSLTWLQLEPLSGRKHQLRIHCSQALHAPILGDTKYGGRPLSHLPDKKGSSPIFLHCRSVCLEDRQNGGRVHIVAEPSKGWTDLLGKQGWEIPPGAGGRDSL